MRDPFLPLKAALVATCLLAGPVLAQTAPLVPWRLVSAPPLTPTQTGDPALWAAPNPSMALFMDRMAGGLRGTNLEDGGIIDNFAFDVFNSVDERGRALLFGRPSGGLAFGTLPEDGGFVPDFASLPASAPEAVALADAHDGGYVGWYASGLQTPVVVAFAITFDGGWVAEPWFTAVLPQQVVGLAADDRTQAVYASMAGFGVVRIDADGTQSEVISVDAGTLGVFSGPLDLYPTDGGVVLFSSTNGANGLVAVHVVTGGGPTLLGTFQPSAADGGAAVLNNGRYLDVHTGALTGFPGGGLIIEDVNDGTYKIIGLDDLATVMSLPVDESAQPPGSDAGVDGGTGTTDGGTGGTGGGGGSGGQGGFGGNTCTGDECRQPRPLCGCASGPLSFLTLLALVFWRRRTFPNS